MIEVIVLVENPYRKSFSKSLQKIRKCKNKQFDKIYTIKATFIIGTDLFNIFMETPSQNISY